MLACTKGALREDVRGVAESGALLDTDSAKDECNPAILTILQRKRHDLLRERQLAQERMLGQSQYRMQSKHLCSRFHDPGTSTSTPPLWSGSSTLSACNTASPHILVLGAMRGTRVRH